ncbi:hypothetical protein KAT67_05790 [candidate division WOR-3 bacterium]|nr:hypothetical protein [candidate division WOR-3 bacterium]MCK4673477.1 hypothetical protein [candidate division WOR-3 bacterium]
MRNGITLLRPGDGETRRNGEYNSNHYKWRQCNSIKAYQILSILQHPGELDW